MSRFLTSVSRWILFMVTLLLGCVQIAAQMLPSGGQIAYVSTQGFRPAIVRMDVARRLTARLTDDSSNGAASYAPAWSPDGNTIAYYALNNGRRDLHLVSADGRHSHQITANGSNNDTPTWSPDGSQIAFISDLGGTYGLYTLSINCTAAFEDCARRLLPPDIHWYAAPSWSPDGSQIAFASNREGLNTNIFVIDSDGKNLRLLTESYGEDYSPAWSPDGNHIVYVGQDVRKGGDLTVFTLALADGVPREIIGGTIDLNPAWSPDGKRLVYASMVDDNFELFIAQADGTYPERLTFNQTDDLAPQWRPDRSDYSTRTGDGE